MTLEESLLREDAELKRLLIEFNRTLSPIDARAYNERLNKLAKAKIFS